MKAAVLVRTGDFNLLLNIQVEYPGVEISQVEFYFLKTPVLKWAREAEKKVSPTNAVDDK